MRSGSVRMMNETLEANQWRFIRAGTYLVLEKLKQAVLRRLLKKVVLLTSEKGNQLALGQSPSALGLCIPPLFASYYCGLVYIL